MSSVVAPSGALNLVVADTGKGMTAEEALRALQPFEQIGGDAALGGIGLGLPIAKALAEANGGRLIIESEGLATPAAYSARPRRTPTTRTPRAVPGPAQAPSDSATAHEPGAR